MYIRIAFNIKNRDGHHIILKGTICQEYIEILNLHEADKISLKCIKSKLTKFQGAIYISKIIMTIVK